MRGMALFKIEQYVGGWRKFSDRYLVVADRVVLGAVAYTVGTAKLPLRAGGDFAGGMIVCELLPWHACGQDSERRHCGN